MLTDAQSYHALNSALSANYEALKKLWEKHGSWHRAWEAEKRQYPAPKNDSELADCELILRQDPAYPGLLKEIDWPPLVSYVLTSQPFPAGGKNRFAPRPSILVSRMTDPFGFTMVLKLKSVSKQPENKRRHAPGKGRY